MKTPIPLILCLACAGATSAHLTIARAQNATLAAPMTAAQIVDGKKSPVMRVAYSSNQYVFATTEAK